MGKIEFKEFPNLKSHTDKNKYFRMLALEIQKYGPVKAANVEIGTFFGQYVGKQVNLYRRLKRAYKKYGMRGVHEQITMLIQRSARTIPVDTEDGVVEKRMIPAEVSDYFTNLRKLINNWVVPNRVESKEITTSEI
jgi:hypothetical protein